MKQPALSFVWHPHRNGDIIFMNKKDILELKRRFKKDACTFTRLCGCYVDADHNKVTSFGETFLNLEDEEF